jgi:hypothetical protein
MLSFASHDRDITPEEHAYKIFRRHCERSQADVAGCRNQECAPPERRLQGPDALLMALGHVRSFINLSLLFSLALRWILEKGLFGLLRLLFMVRPLLQAHSSASYTANLLC